MFSKLRKDIDTLNVKEKQLDADWNMAGDNALLRFYVKTMPRVLNAERCNIFIYDPTAKVIWLKAGTGLEREVIKIGEKDETILGEVISTGKHKVVQEIAGAEGIHKQIDEKAGLVTRDILAVPIMSVDGSQVMGAVEILNKSDGSRFTDADRVSLQEMAHYLEVAIESISFHLESTRLLNRLSRTLTVATSAILWIVGLTVLAVIGRVIWVGLKSVIP
jgi:Nif-specific regulatory protein/two-component system response regulator HydG